METPRVARVVTVSLDEIIDCGGLDGFLDILEELFFAEDPEEERGILSDITYKIFRNGDEGNTLRIRVEAEIEPF